MNEFLPILEVTEDNIEHLWPTIDSAIKNSAFVAVDCELSGLGERKKLNCSEVDLRYSFTRDTARTHSVVSLGLSCFLLKSVNEFPREDKNEQTDDVENEGKTTRRHNYLVESFNILTLCTDPYIVEAPSLKFLGEHGFDFNKQYAKGLPYYRGPDKENEEEVHGVRKLFSNILKYEKPLVTHNGYIDLAFLYQSFYCDLPKHCDTFAADLTGMFPNGLYDTKYLAEFTQRLPATYLEYLFKRMQLKNYHRHNTGDWHVQIEFPTYPADMESVALHHYREIHTYIPQDDQLEICRAYAFHGWCSKGDKCNDSHNVNKIVNELQINHSEKSSKVVCAGGRPTSSLRDVINTENQKVENEMDTDCCISEDVLSDEEMFTKSCDIKIENKDGIEDIYVGNIINKPLQNGSHKNEKEYIAENKTDILNIPDETLVNYQKKIKLESLAVDEKNIKLNDSKKEVLIMNEKYKPRGHSAGYDAFMTGYLLAFYISTKDTLVSLPPKFSPEEIGLKEDTNKIYLIGKSIPFLIRMGSFAKMSNSHMTKIKLIRGYVY